MIKQNIPKALTIAGSDSGGGAGVQADLKTFSALGVYGMSAITAVTAQNTLSVMGVENLSPEFAALQIEAVMTDMGCDAAKTGMLSTPEIVEAVAGAIRKHAIHNLVVDPVMISKSGHDLLIPEAKQALIKHILPLAMVATPNTPEAEALAGCGKIDTWDKMEEAARAVFELGPNYVVVKGGHMKGAADDLFFDGHHMTRIPGERIATKNTHGTGCTFSAALAAGLAKGYEPLDAVVSAKSYIANAIQNSLAIGRGFGPTHHFAALYKAAKTGW